MKNARQVFLGILIALTSLGLTLGAFSVSMAEGKLAASQAATPPITQTFSPTLLPATPSAESPTESPTLTPTLNASLTPTTTPTWTPSLSPTPTTCPARLGWVRYVVKPGDSLATIAAHYRISLSELQQANCLPATGLLPGVIQVPPAPVQTAVRCGPPPTWIVYIVQPHDTLYRLSQAYGVGIDQLQQANCMGNSNLLLTGQKLYVPPWAARIPSPTAPVVTIPTELPTITPEASLPADTPTDVPTSIATDTPVPLPSDTPVEVPTNTLETAVP